MNRMKGWFRLQIGGWIDEMEGMDVWSLCGHGGRRKRGTKQVILNNNNKRR